MGVDDSGPAIPEWARYLAVDADGSVWAYAREPHSFNGREWMQSYDDNPTTRCLWNPHGPLEEQGPMPPSLACRLIVPLASRPQSVESA